MAGGAVSMPGATARTRRIVSGSRTMRNLCRWRLPALLAQRGRIEHDLNGVKERKASLSQDAYYDELEGVLVKLALLQKQIDAKQGMR